MNSSQEIASPAEANKPHNPLDSIPVTAIQYANVTCQHCSGKGKVPELIAHSLKSRRITCGFTQPELIDIHYNRTGKKYSIPFISDIENGKRKINDALLTTYALLERKQELRSL